MLSQWLHAGTIQCREHAENWQQALALSAEPLLKAGVITPEYVQAVITQHEKLGPYYVLAPGLAMPHTRPEDGAQGMGLSLLKLEQGVAFGSADFDPVTTIIMLAAPDSHSHINMISALAELFSCDEDLQRLHHANSVEGIQDIISHY
ncbi:PTS ascorbate transporter subunit IIA [Mangrovibacter phragmitis]|jgi:PTS system ascorbate-specific IIA component|uniref:PTS ascorbate transporter subunit IIA n=1 Tax=Mangrovibacter phragmitis TaxID=1691903 RepID=A0A1B7L9R9_9ENTR|nr:PTS sugar transporter subunit IIA [Mangrovibacter phragmitis]OAT79078.1 PTS ascorbate transporter subunit IIA [Mangrovibacter phragmitis]